MNLRRRWLWALACLGWVSTTRVAAQHVPERELLQPYVGTARIQRDRVKLELPRLADNGFTVPLKVIASRSKVTATNAPFSVTNGTGGDICYKTIVVHEPAPTPTPSADPSVEPSTSPSETNGPWTRAILPPPAM